jgi:very-short-patch-repair endonuclease
MPRNTTPYSEKEKNLLIEIFEHSSKAYILEQFPTRDPQSLFKLAKKLGLKRSQELINKDIFKNGCPKKESSWTENEINTLKEIYTNNSRAYIESKLPGRTWKGIVIRARKLGLHRNKELIKTDRESELIKTGVMWSPEEDQVLREIYPHSSKKVILETIHKPWTAIHRRALKLRLYRDTDLIDEDRKIRYKPRKDACSEEEKQILLQFFEHNTKEFILEKFSKFNRSPQSIVRFARQLGLKRDPEILYQERLEASKKGLAANEEIWDPKEDQILIEFYAISSQKELEEKLPGRTFRAIRERALRLGLSRNKEAIDKDREIKNKKTLMEKYGVDCSLKIPETAAKSLQTNLDRRGFPYHTQTQEGRDNIKKTVQERYGKDNVFQVKEFQDTARESLYKNGTQRCSKQQAHIADLLQGKINYPVGNCNVDILIDDKIICEYDGGGHYLQVKLGYLTQKEFDDIERKREIFLKLKGYKLIRIISREDLLPIDEILLKMINEGKEYLKSGHTWIIFNIDEKQVRCSQYQTDFDFGTLRKIFN